MTFVPVQKLCVHIHIYICILDISYVIERIYIYIYIYIHTTGVSFSIGEAAPHHILYNCISRACAVSGLNATCLVFLFGLPIVSCSLINSLILGCL